MWCEQDAIAPDRDGLFDLEQETEASNAKRAALEIPRRYRLRRKQRPILELEGCRASEVLLRIGETQGGDGLQRRASGRLIRRTIKERTGPGEGACS